MKDFFKMLLATLTAMTIYPLMALVGLFVLSFFFIKSFDSSESLRTANVLKIDLSSGIIEHSIESPPNFLVDSEDNPLVLTNIVDAIRRAATDDDIQVITLENDDIPAGPTQLQTLRKALEEFRKSGKQIIAYGNTMSQNAYLLSTVADKIILNPAGSLDLQGLGVNVTYFKDFIDKYGVGLQVIRHGNFKAAVEPFLRNTMSEENRLQISTLLQDQWAVLEKQLQTSLRLDPEIMKTAIDSLTGLQPVRSYQIGLVSYLGQYSEFEDYVKKLVKQKDASELLATISIQDYIKNENKIFDTQQDHIAVLYAMGEISRGSGGINDENFLEQLREIRKNPSVKGILLRVNSPGGDANLADEILFELQQIGKKVPIVTSFGDVAASGGYYIAMASKAIFADPQTVTGSIGVFGVLPNVKSLVEKNGIHTETITTHRNSHLYSPTTGLSADGQAIMQRRVDAIYNRFVNFVAQNRNKSFSQVDSIAQGRIWSGIRAKQIGLVDHIGGLEDAKNHITKMIPQKNMPFVDYPEIEISIKSQIRNTIRRGLIHTLMASLSEQHRQLLLYFQQLPQDHPSIQMRLPFQLSN